jgi:hypothetical protein
MKIGDLEAKFDGDSRWIVYKDDSIRTTRIRLRLVVEYAIDDYTLMETSMSPAEMEKLIKEQMASSLLQEAQKLAEDVGLMETAENERKKMEKYARLHGARVHSVLVDEFPDNTSDIWIK